MKIIDAFAFAFICAAGAVLFGKFAVDAAMSPQLHIVLRVYTSMFAAALSLGATALFMITAKNFKKFAEIS